MASPELFEKDPALAWRFYGERQQMCRVTTPHRGYELLKQWGEGKKLGYFAYTSNVDGHFHFAGYPGDRVAECHGNLHYNQCCEPCHDQVWLDIPDEHEREQMGDEMPIFFCPQCRGVARPNVLMFGDWDWIREPTEQQMGTFEAWTRALQAQGARVAMVEIGAGTTLPAIRMQTSSLLSRLDGRLIRINLREADGEGDTLSIPLSALAALEAIERVLLQRSEGVRHV
jgi:NAD-dependent SIR2 family protein deacetylase